MLQLERLAFTAFNNYHMFLGWGIIGAAFIFESRVHNGDEEFHYRRLALGIALIIFALTFLWIELLPFTSFEQRIFLRMSSGFLMLTFVIYIWFCISDMFRATWKLLSTTFRKLSRPYR
jgi:phosphatidylserine synthase